MNYEQKYKEALEKLRAFHRDYKNISHLVDVKEELESIFPELKESEDERIRTLLISSVKNETPIASEHNKELAIAWLEKQGETEDEDDTDFTIYHPLKNGSGKYECIPYSFYGSLTSFSEDEDLINFLRNCFYTEKECKEWIEKQGEQNTIVNESPSKEMILAVWELGNIWKELTKGSSCTEYGTQLQYIQKHWNESGYYEKLQGEQKPIDKVEPKFHEGEWITIKE